MVRWTSTLALVLATVAARTLLSAEGAPVAPGSGRVWSAPAVKTSVAEIEQQRQRQERTETLLRRLADGYIKKQDYSAKIAEARKMLERRRDQLGEQTPRRIAAMAQLRDALVAMDQIDEAQQWAERTLELAQKVYGPEHWQTRDAMTALGTVRIMAAADAGPRRALRDARAWIGIANMALDKDEVHLSSLCTLAAMKASKSVLGENSPEFAETAEQAGRMYAAIDDRIRAYTMFGVSEMLRKKMFGEDHPATVRSSELFQSMKKRLDDDPLYLQQMQARIICELFGWDYDELWPELRKDLQSLQRDRK